ncbi:MAG: peptidylprolyl isomerase [Candidatus Didemnitutus sp.]|nr:peptidylprolyl isomerase [Candidatus Didemnitutus sp.]
MRRFLLLFAASLVALCHASDSPLPDGLYAEFTTPHGAFVVELYADRAPMTVASFVGRAEGTLAPRDGQPFFTGLRWYRVVPDFVIQSGDPVRSAAAPGAKLTEEDDAAGHPLSFPDEFAPGLHHARAGILSMANGGPDTNSSEFFLTLRDTHRLNYMHSVFGGVVRGLDLLPLVQQDESFSIKILRVGAAAQAFRADEASFAALVANGKKYSGSLEPGATAHFDDPDQVLPQDPPRARGFNFKLANYERFTGRKVYARVFKEFRSFSEGQKLGAYHRELAEQLGVADDGVLVSYFADLDTWVIWISEPLLPGFMGRAGTREEFLDRSGLMNRKHDFVDGAKARGAAAAAAALAAGRAVTDGQRIKLVVDEVIDALILIYEPQTN